jgi:hypothetical protein
MTASVEMPKYVSHKEVWALKIRAVYPTGNDEGPTGAQLVPEEKGYAAFQVSQAYLDKHEPVAGGYYVVYQDGYKSFSPAEAFESGYTRKEV